MMTEEEARNGRKKKGSRDEGRGSGFSICFFHSTDYGALAGCSSCVTMAGTSHTNALNMYCRVKQIRFACNINDLCFFQGYHRANLNL